MIAPQSGSSRRLRVTAWLAAGAALAVVAFPGLVRGLVFCFTDFHQTFEPSRVLVRESLRRGSILWAPGLDNGSPLLANPIHQLLYPPNLVALVLPASVGLTILAILHLAWGALGTFLLSRRTGSSPSAASVAASLFGLSGIAVSSMAMPNIGTSMAWLPWLLLAAERALDRPVAGARLRFSAAPAFALLALVLVGEPTGLAGGALLVAFLALSRFAGMPPGERPSAIVRLGLPCVAGLLVAAPILRAMYLYARQSVRGEGLEGALAGTWSLHPPELLGLLVADPWGSPERYGVTGFFARLLQPEMGHPLFAGLWIGALPVGLAIVGLTRPGDRRRFWLAGAGAALLLLAFGRHLPVHAWLVRLPGVSSFRYPAKWLAPAMLPLALLAGGGFDAVLGALRTGEVRSRVLAGLAIPLVLVAGFSVATTAGLDRRMVALSGIPEPVAEPATPAEKTISDLWESLLWIERNHLLEGVVRSAAPALVVLLLVVRPPRKLSGPAGGAILAGLVALDLAAENGHLAPMVPTSFYERRPLVVAAIEAEPAPRGRLWAREVDYAGLVFSPPLDDIRDLFAWQRDTLQRYVPLSWGIDLAFSVDTEARAPARYARLRSTMFGSAARERLMLLGAAGVTHILSQEDIRDPAAVVRGDFPNRSSRPFRLYRNLLAQPRARLVSHLTLVDGEAGLAEILKDAPAQFFAGTAIVDRSEPVPDGVDLRKGGGGEGRVEIGEDSGGHLLIRVRGGGGWLVVGDVLVPGWSATLDGRPASMVAADLAFRGLFVSAGEHDVVMDYRPFR